MDSFLRSENKVVSVVRVSLFVFEEVVEVFYWTSFYFVRHHPFIGINDVHSLESGQCNVITLSIVVLVINQVVV